MVFKALSCITSRLDSIKDSYGIALVTYTLMLAKHSYASKMMKLLRDKAVKKGEIINNILAFIHTYVYISLFFIQMT